MTAPAVDLKPVLKFTESDLNANRGGELSAAQIAKLNRDKRRIALIALALFIIFVLISTALIYIGQNSQDATAFVGGFILVLTNALTIGVLGREFMRLDGDQRTASVEVLAGKVERVIKRGRRGDRYLLRIDNHDVYVNRETLDCFEQGARYRLYRTQRSHLLLSAELQP